jgi:4-hydroxy-tetrahydrodipicolinate reductase
MCAALLKENDLELVAAVDPKLVGIDLMQVLGVPADGLEVSGDPSAFKRARADVVVDFSEARNSSRVLPWLAGEGIRAVVGTTGFSVSELDGIKQAFDRAGVGCIVAANFSIGAILMMKCAEMLAPFFDTVEIVELHHDEKVDAPSGTAITTAERINSARSSKPFGNDPTNLVRIDGARGAVADGGIHIHSVRMRGMVAHQEVIFGTRGQTITIRHDSYSRDSFVPGVLLALRAVEKLDGFMFGIEDLIDQLEAE